MTGNKQIIDRKAYSFRFSAHDSSGVGNGIGEGVLQRIGPIVDPVLTAAEPVVRKVVVYVGGKLIVEMGKAVGVTQKGQVGGKDLDESGIL